MNFLLRIIFLIATFIGLSRVIKRNFSVDDLEEYELPESVKKILKKIQYEANRVDEVITDAIEEGKKTFQQAEEELNDEFDEELDENNTVEDDKP
jgi:Na+-transporting methylmalonyl-CoA/oxaloacetate decarboxylase gamma subunit